MREPCAGNQESAAAGLPAMSGAKARAAIVLGLCAGLAALAPTAHAATLSFSGTLTQDDQIVLFPFNVTAASDATFRTLSYGGGLDAGGDPVSPGGFDPVLSLFDGTGNLLIFVDDGAEPDIQADPVTDLALDSFFTDSLSPGDYTLALSQSNNYPGLTLADAFSRQGEGNFTATYGCGAGAFHDFGCNARGGNYHVEVVAAQTGVVPLPLSGILFLTGLGSFVPFARRRAGGPDSSIPRGGFVPSRPRSRVPARLVVIAWFSVLAPVPGLSASSITDRCFGSRAEAEAAPIFRCAGYQGLSISNNDGTSVYQTDYPGKPIASGLSLNACQAAARAFVDTFATSMRQYEGLQCIDMGFAGTWQEWPDRYRECNENGESFDSIGTEMLLRQWHVQQQCPSNESRSGPWYGVGDAVAWIGGFSQDQPEPRPMVTTLDMDGFFVVDKRCPVPLLTKVDRSDPDKSGYSSTKVGLIQQYHVDDPVAADLTRRLERGDAQYDLLTPAMKAAEQCLRAKFANVGLSYAITATVRTKAYQKHFVELNKWERELIPEALDDPDNDLVCQRVITAVEFEYGCYQRDYGQGHCIQSPPAEIHSKHEDGNAIDIQRRRAEDLRDKLLAGVKKDSIAPGKPAADIPANTNVNSYIQECGLEWGGYWTPIDIPHFQLRAP